MADPERENDEEFEDSEDDDDEFFKCPQCGRFFGSDSDLKFHIQVKHEAEDETKMKKPIACTLCDKSFTTEDLVTHVLSVHQGTKQCNVCQRYVVNTEELAQHIITKHSEQDN